MSILNNTQQELTLAQKQEKAAARAFSLAKQTYQQLTTAQKQGIQIVWDNPQGLTPQEVVDGMGDKAVKVFEFHGSLTDLIVELATQDGVTPDIALPKKNFTKNPDGTVTILSSDYGT